MVRAWMEEEEESRNKVGTKMDVLMDNWVEGVEVGKVGDDFSGGGTSCRLQSYGYLEGVNLYNSIDKKRTNWVINQTNRLHASGSHRKKKMQLFP